MSRVVIREPLCKGGGALFADAENFFVPPPLATLYPLTLKTPFLKEYLYLFNYVKVNYSIIYTHITYYKC